MKFYFTQFILLFVVSFGFSQTTVIPDANFEQDLVNQGIDTNGLNGNILDADAQAVTALTLTGTNIVDITGINAFVNLTNLDLGDNPVTDVSPTALMLLTDFRSNDNPGLANLDFSQNALLQNVFIHGPFPGTPPPITTIDFSQNLNLVSFNGDFLDNVNDIIFPVTPTLTTINVRYLNDPTFDLSLLSGLEDLNIGGWRGNTTITLPNVFTNLERLRISSIDIPTIDISDYINLENLYLWGTYVENLILPNSTTLTDIFITLHDIQNPLDFSILPNLTDLYITSNRITPLVVDVTQNPLLEGVNLGRNDMNSIDLTQNAVLRVLSIENNNLTNLDVTQNPVLYRFNASNNQLPSIDLTQNVILQYLNLSYNQLPNLDVTQNIILRSINVSHNLFTGTGLDLIQNVELSSIYASNNQIESLDITQNINLYTLDISFNIFPGNAILNQFYTIVSNRGRLLGSLIANNNLLTGLVPDFYGLYSPTIQTRRFQLFINENRFHFGDFENQHLGLVDLTTTMSIGPSPDVVIRNYLYAPQAKVNAIENLNQNAGDTVTLTTVVRGAENHYTWYKDGVAIPGAPDSPNYVIPSVNSCDEGIYHCEITSDLVPFENANPPGTSGKNLLLIRNDITLNVNSPVETCTTLTNPINGSTNIPLNELLTWTESLGACGYFLNVGTTAGGTDILNNVDVGDVEQYNIGSNFPVNTQIFVTITPYFNSGIVLNCTEESFTTNTTVSPTTCTTLSAPLSSATNVLVDTDITWDVADYANGYFLSIGTISGGTDILNNFDVGNQTTFNPPLDFPEGTEIYVNIIPYNTLGNATGCMEESFITETTATIPNCTSIDNPDDGDINVAVSANINWDDIADATGYILIVGTTSGGTDIVDNLDVNNIFTYDFPTNLPENSEIFVTVIPYNSVGNATGCIEESFTTEALVPNCTTLNLPPDGATNISVSSDISWNAITNATGYFISMGTTSGATDLVNNEDVGNATIYNPPTNFPSDSEIFVTITPYNLVGNATGCTEESFTTEVLLAECINMTFPMYDATNVPIDTNISWPVSTNASYYTIGIGTATGSDNIIATTNIGNATTFNPPIDLPSNTIIYVTITAYNSLNLGTVCGDDRFTTTEALPLCTDLIAPLNGATNVSVSSAISWNPVSNATGYYISVGTFPAGTEFANKLDIGSATTYSANTDFPSNQMMHVLVIPYNAIGEAIQNCDEETFTTEMVAPNCTTLSFPINAATGVALSSNISWDAITNATGYFISIGTTSGVTDLVNNEDVGNTTTYNPSVDFPDDTEIFVTITPYNSIGNATGCLEESFRTTAINPICTRLTTPTNGAINVSVSSDISWNTISNATGYFLSIGTNPAGNNIVDFIDVGNTTIYNPINDFPDDTEVFVRITPYNSAGNASGCLEERFTTQVIIPDCTTLISPSNTATNVQVDAIISWDFIDNATGYFISIGTSSGAKDIANAIDVGNLTSYNPPTEFPDGSEIFVTITPYNSAGNAVLCSEESFSIENRALVVPRFFTPNNDGFNDVWKITDPKNEVRRITIFDRYGKLLKTLVSAASAWDGSSNGQLLSTNDYWCVIELKDGSRLRKHFTLKL